MKDFKGKVAVVTGAASGIGRGMAERFAAEGMHVVLADVEAPALEAAEKEMAAAGASVLAVRTDVSSAADVGALAERTIERFGKVHVLCNNAGVGGGAGAWDTSIEDWQWVLGVNLWGVVHGVRSFVPLMIAGGEEAHIVNTASVAGLMPGAGGAGYTATKFAVVGYSEALYYELLMSGSARIGVSVLCPAATATNIIDSDRNRPGGPPELGITVDVGHCLVVEPDGVVGALRAAAPYLANVQLDDMPSTHHEHRPFGEGEIDLPLVLATLADVGYTGVAAVELPRHSYDAPGLAHRSLTALHAAWAEAAGVDRTPDHPQEVP